MSVSGHMQLFRDRPDGAGYVMGSIIEASKPHEQPFASLRIVDGAGSPLCLMTDQPEFLRLLATRAVELAAELEQRQEPDAVVPVAGPVEIPVADDDLIPAAS